VGIVVAVREELEALRRRMSPVEVESVGGISFYRGHLGGQAVVLAKSGMGAERAWRLTEALIARFAPRLLMIAGFGAALTEDVRPGDLVIAEWVDRTPKPPSSPGPSPLSPLFLPRSGESGRGAGGEGSASRGIRVYVGGLLTCPAVTQTAAEKRRLADLRAGAVALDMETAGAAAAAEAAGIPWLAVRAITDGLNDGFPFDFSRFVGADGEVSRRRLALAVLIHPWQIPALIRLGMRASLAARNLAAFVERYAGALGNEELLRPAQSVAEADPQKWL